MNLTLRPGTPADAERCGTICYEAFKAIADRHRFPPDFPSPQAAVAATERRFAHASYYAVVAELEGRIVGSVFLDERSAIASVASITVDPAAQNRMIGRRLMEAVLQRVDDRRCPGVRLVQAAYHTRSLSLYTKLGFEVPSRSSPCRDHLWPCTCLDIQCAARRRATSTSALRCVFVYTAATGAPSSGRRSNGEWRPWWNTPIVSPATRPGSGSRVMS